MIGDYNYTFYGGEAANETMHSFTTTFHITTCNKTALELSPSLPSLPIVSQGETTTMTFNVRNGNTIFCDPVLVVLAAELGKEMAGLVRVDFGRNNFVLKQGDNSVWPLFSLFLSFLSFLLFSSLFLFLSFLLSSSLFPL